MTIVLHQHRLIFIKARKTGGTSIEVSLSKFAHPSDVLTKLEPASDEAFRHQISGRNAQNFQLGHKQLGSHAKLSEILHFLKHPVEEYRVVLVKRQNSEVYRSATRHLAVREHNRPYLWRGLFGALLIRFAALSVVLRNCRQHRDAYRRVSSRLEVIPYSRNMLVLLEDGELRFCDRSSSAYSHEVYRRKDFGRIS